VGHQLTRNKVTPNDTRYHGQAWLGTKVYGHLADDHAKAQANARDLRALKKNSSDLVGRDLMYLGEFAGGDATMELVDGLLGKILSARNVNRS